MRFNTLFVAIALVASAFADSDRPLKVLMIGNSFSESCLRQTPAIAKSMGCKLDIANLYIGGCTLKTHWSNVVAGNVLGPDFRPYRYNRWTDGTRAVSNDTINIVGALEADRWDIVTLQQGVTSCADVLSYDYAITYLVHLIRQKQPQAKIMLQETWSLPPWDHRLKKIGCDGPEMYRRLHAAYGKFSKMLNLGVIPVGTVAEKTPERTRLFKNGDFHFNTEGEYLQGLVWTATLFGVDVTKCGYRPKVVDAERAEVLRNTVMRNISK